MSPAAETARRDPRPEVMGDPAWWAPGLALHERISAGRPLGAAADTEAAQRWRAAADPGLDAAFQTRLAGLGLDEAGLSALLAETPADLATRAGRPAWADTVEEAVHRAGTLPAIEVTGTGWQQTFALPLRPFVLNAVDQLAKGIAHLPDHWIDRAGVTASFTATLNHRLVALAARAMVAELHRRRAAGQLAGADGAARYADFLRQLGTQAGLAGFVAGHPVLARLLGQASTATTAATVELLTRFGTDRADLVSTLLDGFDPGTLTAVEAGKGDAHRGGRSATTVRFADQRQLVYKPRDLTAQVRLGELLDWLNQAVPGLGLRAAATLPRPGYGWSEFITDVPLADTAGADTFYRRQGALLALLHALQATDIHCENLIAAGDCPVLVDLETLFHPELAGGPDSGDPAAAALAASVHRTALLPLIVVGEQGALDLSGLGGDQGRTAPASMIDWLDHGTDRMRLVRRARPFDGARNRPRLDSGTVDPGQHVSALLEGFRLGYDAITARAAELIVHAESFADLEIRVVVRPTWTYQLLLDETTHPEVLRDALDRDRALATLCHGRDHPLFAQLLQPELTDLWAGDVPLFTATAGGTELRAADGTPLPVPLGRSGLAAATDTIAGFGEVDRQDQEWIIAAALATRHPAGGHLSSAPFADALTGTAAPPDRLLAAACGVADQIIARGIPGPDRVNWLGLELVDDRQWLVLPMGAGLATGHIGVALFLAQTAELSGINRYAEQARRALRSVPQLFDALAGRPDLTAAVGCGGLHGFGGIGYGLARLATLLDEPELGEWAAAAVQLAGVAAEASADPSWATGFAGCLAAMRAVHTELGLTAADSLARACADELADIVLGAKDGELPAGFADGYAGIAWALARDPRHRETAVLAVRRAEAAAAPEAGLGWCGGAAGVALASTCVTGRDPGQQVSAFADRPVLRDLSLCHGELGIVEALTVLPERTTAAVARVRRRRAGLLLEAIGRHGPSCGVPGGVSTPGLLNGLAGIGYGLLRLGLTDRVPSALLLQPTPELSAPTYRIPIQTTPA